MNKYILTFFCALTFLFVGCSKPNALSNFNYEKFYGNSLQYTLKNDIVVNENIVAMLNSTYLNATGKNPEYSLKEVFLVGVFVSSSDEKDILSNKKYSLTLNELKPESIRQLDKNDKMYAKMPLYNPWAKYYIVKFDKKDLNKEFLKELTKREKYTKFEYNEVVLKLTIDDDLSTTLTYQKEL